MVSARYTESTTAYDHGVLGDAVEHLALEVTLSDGRRLSVRHALPMLFEDTAPRLWDVTGDGAPEVVTVETHMERGARLAVWAWDGTGLTRHATGAFIGQSRRWLAPVGAADLDGDGRIEIAYVDRPHLAQTLRVFRIAAGGLQPVAEAPNLTNHRIGWAHIAGGLRDCGAGPELILASGDWRRVMAVTLSQGRLVARDLGPWSPGALDAARGCEGSSSR